MKLMAYVDLAMLIYMGMSLFSGNNISIGLYIIILVMIITDSIIGIIKNKELPIFVMEFLSNDERKKLPILFRVIDTFVIWSNYFNYFLLFLVVFSTGYTNLVINFSLFFLVSFVIDRLWTVRIFLSRKQS